MKIWTDDECIEVDPNDVGQLEAAMLFKAEHIKAKADPEMFSAVADMLSRLWDSATKRVDVVRCRECKRHGKWKRSGALLECQRCGEIYSQLGGNAGKSWNYCPNCGCKMDLEEEQHELRRDL